MIKFITDDMTFKNSIYVFLIATLLLNCSSSDDPITNPTGKITYNANIKSIINNNCTSCHGSPTTNGAPMSLTTYSLVKSAVETRGLIDRINNTSNPMPQSGLMTQATRDLIQQWVNDGLLEN
jgi:uncharacterized membrane protein